MNKRNIWLGLMLMLIGGLGGGLAQTTPVSQKENKMPTAMMTTEPIILETPTGKIYGTLLLPKSSKLIPVAIIIAGSGPTNRDGNSPALPGANNSLKYLAEGLSAQGIATLRYDKRGVGESVNALAKEEDIRFDHYIDDVVLWAQKLRTDKRFSTLTIIGHSEGSLIGMIAAHKAKANAYVSIAGVGRSMVTVLQEQLKPALPPEMYAQANTIMKELLAGNTVKDVPPGLVALFRPSVQPYMISWFKYDSASEIAKLKIPVLIAQGTHDLQVKVEDARALAAAKPDAKLLIIEGMNHVLKATPAEREKQLKSYSDPELPVVPELIAEISKLSKAAKK